MAYSRFHTRLGKYVILYNRYPKKKTQLTSLKRTEADLQKG